MSIPTAAQLEKMRKSLEQFPESVPDKFEFIGQYVFGFSTYEDVVMKRMVKRCVEVCQAISRHETFEYYNRHPMWYLVMINMPFISTRIEWGTSCRGAWWVPNIELNGNENYLPDEQIAPGVFNESQWAQFIDNIAEYLTE